MGGENGLPEWAQWILVLAPAGTFIVAVSAAIVAWRTLKHRTRADAREHWWERTRWAIERAQDSGDAAARRVGIDILRLQANSNLARDEDWLIMDAIQEPILDAYHERSAEDIQSGTQYVVHEVPEEAEGGAGDVDQR